jgi:hypothetical protein
MKTILDYENYWVHLRENLGCDTLNFHQLFFKHKNLQVDYDNLKNFPSWKLINIKNGQYQKVSDTSFGEVTFAIFSNKDPITKKQSPKHTVEIIFKGKISEKNYNNKNVKDKSSIPKREVQNFFTEIKLLLLQMKNNKEIQFNKDTFDKFVLYKLGINFDYVIKGKVHSTKNSSYKPDITIESFMQDMTIRWYEYKKHSTGQVMGRALDVHGDSVDDTMSTVKFLETTSNLSVAYKYSEQNFEEIAKVRDDVKEVARTNKQQMDYQNLWNKNTRNHIKNTQLMVIKGSEIIHKKIQQQKVAIENMNGNIDDLNTQSTVLEASIDSMDGKLDKTVENIENYSKSITQYAKSNTELNEKSNEIIMSFAQIVNKLDDNDRFHDETILSQQTELQTLNNNVKTTNDILDKLVDRLTLLDVDKKKIESELELMRARMNESFWKKAKRKIKGK